MTTLWNARGHVNNKCNLKCKGTNTQSTQIKSSNPGLLFLLKSTLEKKEKKITQQQHKKKDPPFRQGEMVEDGAFANHEP